jgi:POT family proton-dependent oligopeptide transporter
MVATDSAISSSICPMTITRLDSDRLADSAFLGHPRGLGWLGFTEFWERFSYYGMQALLVLYMTHQLLQPGHVERVVGFGVFRRALESVYGPLSPQSLASVIFGLYAGLVFVTPIAGGFLADRLWGRTWTITAGALTMAAGHFLMAFDATFLLALLCLLVGAGCFKGNLAAQVGDLYAPGDTRRANGFQLYFVAINVAVIVAPLICGTLGERVGYHWGFGAAGIGMVIGLLIYLSGRAWLPREPPRRRSPGAPPRPGLAPGDGRKLLVLLALLPVIGIALVGNFQIFNAYLIWAEATYELRVFGMNMPVTWLLAAGSLIAVAILAGSVVFWRWWGRHRAEPSEITKMAIGGLFLACSPLVLALASYTASVTGHRVGLGWSVVYEIINDIGYANLLPIGLSLYARAAPKAVGGMMTGIYYVHLFIANMLVGWVGALLERMSAVHFWLLHAALVLGAAVVLLLVRNGVKNMFAEAVPAASLPHAATPAAALAAG